MPENVFFHRPHVFLVHLPPHSVKATKKRKALEIEQEEEDNEDEEGFTSPSSDELRNKVRLAGYWWGVGVYVSSIEPPQTKRLKHVQ